MFLSFADFFFHYQLYRKRISNSLDQDLTRSCIGPGLGRNCSLRLSADDIRRQGVQNITSHLELFYFLQDAANEHLDSLPASFVC